ncbi:MAG: diguanylate cyclase [Arcobacteraceae bacterium]
MYNILYIDLVLKEQSIIKQAFSKYNFKYTLTIVTSLEEAYDTKLMKATDLILLHVVSPEIGGFETAKLLKSLKEIPIIFVCDTINDNLINNCFLYGDDYLVHPYNEVEFFKKIEVQIKLLNLNKRLEEETLFNESIMESSNNILFIHGEKGIVKSNRVFLNFFQVKNTDEFNRRYNSISEVFMEYESFYSKYILNDDENWLDKLSHEKISNDYKVLIMDLNTFEPKAFQIHVTALKNLDKFLVTLVDITKITMKSKQFEIKATYDNLTKIYNRSKFNELIEIEYKNAINEQEPLCFAMIDIDHFKEVNDVYGHMVGDETLITFAKTINKLIREGDIFARWGGEEFTLLLPSTDITKAHLIVDELREAIENVTFKLIGKKTCSIGLTQFKENDTIKDVIIRADNALYEAKKSGRNKVCLK